MITDRYAALRAAIPYATIGPWEHVFSNGGREHYVYATKADYRADLPGPVKVAWMPYSPNSNRDANDAAYIAAANPEIIAALLAERDALFEWYEASQRLVNQARDLAIDVRDTMEKGVRVD